VVLPAGTRLSVAELRDLVHGDPARGIRRPPDGTAGPADGGAVDGAPGTGGGAGAAGGSEEAARPLPEIMAAAERRFDTAAGQRDADAMVGVILGLETAITQWEADMDEDQGTEQARALLRGLIGRLGRAAEDGLADPRDRLAPAVEPLLALRATLRGAGDFAAADAIRDALAGAGLDISDTPAGTRWQPAETT
jgi:cysteinyl-tRNA synthetase